MQLLCLWLEHLNLSPSDGPERDPRSRWVVLKSVWRRVRIYRKSGLTPHGACCEHVALLLFRQMLRWRCAHLELTSGRAPENLASVTKFPYVRFRRIPDVGTIHSQSSGRLTPSSLHSFIFLLQTRRPSALSAWHRHHVNMLRWSKLRNGVGYPAP